MDAVVLQGGWADAILAPIAALNYCVRHIHLSRTATSCLLPVVPVLAECDIASGRLWRVAMFGAI